MMRYSKKVEFTHKTIKDAARAACVDIENNTAAPFSIEDNGILIWKNNGPADESYDRLRDLAELSDD